MRHKSLLIDLEENDLVRNAGLADKLVPIILWSVRRKPNHRSKTSCVRRGEIGLICFILLVYCLRLLFLEDIVVDRQIL